MLFLCCVGPGRHVMMPGHDREPRMRIQARTRPLPDGDIKSHALGMAGLEWIHSRRRRQWILRSTNATLKIQMITLRN
ncbi:hypothetical protein C2142_33855 [Streptomyces sp. CB01881]|nr:hypothetical protein C2142_33855 [Streptomyces sp. CB01881]